MKVAFEVTNVSYSEELHLALNGRRAEMMDNAWDILDKDWKKLKNQMVTIEIKKPMTLKGGVVHLNAGGLNMTIRYSELESLHYKIEGSTTPWTLANLFDCVWDSRIPRDKNDRIFLDESPAILKHLVHTQLDTPTKTQEDGMSLDCANLVLAANYRSYLRFFSSAVFGLKTPPFGMEVMGGSTVLKDDEPADLSIHIIRRWCPGGSRCLEHIYRGSRDGFKAHSFHARCTGESPSTITIVKVNHGGTGSGSSIVGGFSSVSLTRKMTRTLVPTQMTLVVGAYTAVGTRRLRLARLFLCSKFERSLATRNLNLCGGSRLQAQMVKQLYAVVPTWDLKSTKKVCLAWILQTSVAVSPANSTQRVMTLTRDTLHLKYRACTTVRSCRWRFFASAMSY